MTSSFTVQEICDILKQCQLSRVGSLILGDLKVEFKPDISENKANSWKTYTIEPEQEAAFPVDPMNSEEINLNQLSPEDNVELLEELRRFELMTNDPLAFEQEMIDNQLYGEARDAEFGHSRTEQDLSRG